MASPRKDAKGYDMDHDAERSKAEHEAILAKEKFDPAMKGGGMSQSQVKAAGGLGALARARGAKPTTDDAAKALAERRKKSGY